jgi:hypothetical protein
MSLVIELKKPRNLAGLFVGAPGMARSAWFDTITDRGDRQTSRMIYPRLCADKCLLH